MKLIDILVEELPKRGGWPEGVVAITQDSDKAINNYKTADRLETNEHGTWRYSSAWEGYSMLASDSTCLASDYDTAIITRDQYEAALAAKNDGWIEWGGGNCPVEKGTLIDVKHRDGEIYQNKPAMGDNNTRWSNTGSRGDIIAYRLHQPQEEEQNKADDEVDLNECIGQDAAPVWNGEGLPPVGMEIEYSFAKVNYRTDFSRGKVLAYGMQSVFMERWESKNEFIQPLDKIEFRPIRSEAERKRDEAVQALCDAGGGNGKVDEKASYGSCWFDVYDAIAAGKIPGVKLED
jgi:hypothetical protein